MRLGCEGCRVSEFEPEQHWNQVQRTVSEYLPNSASGSGWLPVANGQMPALSRATYAAAFLRCFQAEATGKALSARNFLPFIAVFQAESEDIGDFGGEITSGLRQFGILLQIRLVVFGFLNLIAQQAAAA